MYFWISTAVYSLVWLLSPQTVRLLLLGLTIWVGCFGSSGAGSAARTNGPYTLSASCCSWRGRAASSTRRSLS